MQSGVGGQAHLPVAGDGLEGAVVATERDVESHDGLASLDEVQVLLLDAGLVGGVVVEELDLLEETRLVVGIEFGAELLGGGELAEHCKTHRTLVSGARGGGRGCDLPGRWVLGRI